MAEFYSATVRSSDRFCGPVLLRDSHAAGRRAEQQGHALGGQDAQDGVDDGRLAHARPARDDHGLGDQGQANRLGLARRKRQAGLPLDPGQRLAGIDIRPGEPAARDLLKPFADRPFGPVQAAKEYTGRSRFTAPNSSCTTR